MGAGWALLRADPTLELKCDLGAAGASARPSQEAGALRLPSQAGEVPW